MKVLDVMTPNPKTCPPTASIRDVVQVMQQEDCGIVPIVDENDQCLGVVTDRDICLQVILQGLDPKGTPVENIMSKNVLSCRPDHDLSQILQAMKDRAVRRIIVVDDNDCCCGIVTERDIALNSTSKEQVGDFVQKVTQPA